MFLCKANNVVYLIMVAMSIRDTCLFVCLFICLFYVRFCQRWANLTIQRDRSGYKGTCAMPYSFLKEPSGVFSCQVYITDTQDLGLKSQLKDMISWGIELTTPDLKVYRATPRLPNIKLLLLLTTTDRAKVVFLFSYFLCVCLSCILTSNCMIDAVCTVVV